mgnify:CR=1 FL=1
MVTREEFIERAKEIHESKVVGDMDMPTEQAFEEVIQNQKRLAFMLEYIAQRLD